MPNQNEKEIVRIDLNPTQKEQLKAKTGRDADAIDLTVQELEERIAPRGGFLGNNHNETFLLDA